MLEALAFLQDVQLVTPQFSRNFLHFDWSVETETTMKFFEVFEVSKSAKKTNIFTHRQRVKPAIYTYEFR